MAIGPRPPAGAAEVIPQAEDSVVVNTAQLHTITYDSAAPSVRVASLTVGGDKF